MIGGITDAFLELKEHISDNIEEDFIIDLPIKVQQRICFIFAVKTLEHAMIVHVRFQGVTDNFANMNRDKGTITTVGF